MTRGGKKRRSPCVRIKAARREERRPDPPPSRSLKPPRRVGERPSAGCPLDSFQPPYRNPDAASTEIKTPLPPFRWERGKIFPASPQATTRRGKNPQTARRGPGPRLFLREGRGKGGPAPHLPHRPPPLGSGTLAPRPGCHPATEKPPQRRRRPSVYPPSSSSSRLLPHTAGGRT